MRGRIGMADSPTTQALRGFFTPSNMASPLTGAASTIGASLSPIVRRMVDTWNIEDPIQEFNFGGPGYMAGFGGYPAARPLDVIDPYTETYRSAILPRKPEDVTDYEYGQHGALRPELTQYGEGDFAVAERELLERLHKRQDEKQKLRMQNVPEAFATGVTYTNVGPEGKSTFTAPRVDIYPGNRLKFSGGTNQVISPPGFLNQSFADEIEAERQGINFSGDVQDRLRNQQRGFLADTRGLGRVSQPIIDYPTNIHPAITPQIEQPFIPQFDLEPDLNFKPSVISPPEGSVAPYQGPVDWDFTPSREDWSPDLRAISQERDMDNIWINPDTGVPHLSNQDLFGERIHYSDSPSGAVTLDQQIQSEANIGRLIEEALVRQDEQVVEEANVIQEQMVPESERRRLDDIMTQAREDRIAQEKIASDARQAREADERRARELREEAARAEDRQDKARLSREAEERDRQAQERAQEERNAAEAARLNSLAEAADKMAIDQERKQQEEQARKQAEFDKQHEAFIKQMDREWRAQQQASMPKSWAFF
jgi:hypothetical protein